MADAQLRKDTTENLTKHVRRQTLPASLDAVNAWRLNETDSGRHRRARMSLPAAMVASIKTALDITFSSSLSND